MKVIKAKDYADLSRKAANIISAQVIMNPKCVLGLATGSSPIGTYKQLIEWYNKDDVDFSGVTSVNLDEYVGLPEGHEQSYRSFMEETFFKHININPASTFLPDGNVEDLEKECARYDNLITDLGGIDIQILGLGHNGHIGFNEPDDAFEKMTNIVDLGETTIQANARFFASEEEVPKKAITMGIRAIMQAKKIILVVNGNDKYDILKKALTGAITPHVPASVLQLHADLTVIYCCDQEI